MISIDPSELMTGDVIVNVREFKIGGATARRLDVERQTYGETARLAITAKDRQRGAHDYATHAIRDVDDVLTYDVVFQAMKDSFLAGAETKRFVRDFDRQAPGADRNDLIAHLKAEHPAHARAEYVLIGLADIRKEHDRLHPKPPSTIVVEVTQADIDLQPRWKQEFAGTLMPADDEEYHADSQYATSQATAWVRDAIEEYLRNMDNERDRVLFRNLFMSAFLSGWEAVCGIWDQKEQESARFLAATENWASGDAWVHANPPSRMVGRVEDYGMAAFEAGRATRNRALHELREHFQQVRSWENHIDGPLDEQVATVTADFNLFITICESLFG
jgi:hypothetical protein